MALLKMVSPKQRVQRLGPRSHDQLILGDVDEQQRPRGDAGDVANGVARFGAFAGAPFGIFGSVFQASGGMIALAYVIGMLAMGFVGQLLTAWLRRGHVRRLAARFVKIVWPGDELTCRGRIAELRRDAGACYADVELWAENQKGELVLRGQATCELYESPASGGGDGGGLLFALQSPSLPAQPQPRGQKQATPSRPPKPGSRRK